jgi:bifunctional ADP-heptose synthase (sugar kinase/adenylyltransferase)
VVVKGGDYKPQEVVGYGICEVVIFELVSNYSTTNVVENMRNET